MSAGNEPHDFLKEVLSNLCISDLEFAETLLVL